MDYDEESYKRKRELSNIRVRRYRERKKQEKNNEHLSELLSERLKNYREKKGTVNNEKNYYRQKELSHLRVKRYRERKKKERNNELLREHLNNYGGKKGRYDDHSKEVLREYFKEYIRKSGGTDERSKKLSRERSKRYRERKRLEKLNLINNDTDSEVERKPTVLVQPNFINQSCLYNCQIDGPSWLNVPVIQNNENVSHSSQLTVSSNNFDELNINLHTNTQNEDSSTIQHKNDSFILENNENNILITDVFTIVPPVRAQLKKYKNKKEQNYERLKELSRERTRRYRERKRLEKLNAKQYWDKKEQNDEHKKAKSRERTRRYRERKKIDELNPKNYTDKKEQNDERRKELSRERTRRYRERKRLEKLNEISNGTDSEQSIAFHSILELVNNKLNV